MLKNKRAREERRNINIFTWFSNPHLRPCLQANQVWGFHYSSLPRLQMLTIDFQSVNGLYNKRLSPISLPKYIPTLTPFKLDFTKRIKNKFPSHNCVWLQMKAQCVWMNEINTQIICSDCRGMLNDNNGCIFLIEFDLSHFIVGVEN